MSNPAFYVWNSTYIEGFCVIDPPDVSDSFELSKGVSRAAGWSNDVFCEMSDDFPDDIELGDNLEGAELCVVSKRARELLEKHGVTNVEFLPISIKNHKGRIASRDYFVVNPLTLVDCIDVDASGVSWNNIIPDRISTCERLILDFDKIPADATLFRLHRWPEVIIVRSDIADALEAEGMTGMYFVDPATYGGI